MFFFFFNDTATTEIYTLSLHDALPISGDAVPLKPLSEAVSEAYIQALVHKHPACLPIRSEEHTSELQSRPHLVCRLLLEKKKNDWCNMQPTTRRYLTVESHDALSRQSN